LIHAFSTALNGNSSAVLLPSQTTNTERSLDRYTTPRRVVQSTKCLPAERVLAKRLVNLTLSPASNRKDIPAPPSQNVRARLWRNGNAGKVKSRLKITHSKARPLGIASAYCRRDRSANCGLARRLPSLPAPSERCANSERPLSPRGVLRAQKRKAPPHRLGQ
jgi:hypothetical protein